MLLLALVSAGPAAAASPSSAPRGLRAAAAPTNELGGASSTTLPGGAIVHRFQQRVDGFKVLGSQAIVNDAPGSAPRLVADSTKPAIRAPAPARISRERAIDIASAAIGVRGLRARLSADLAIRPGAGGTLVWRILIPAAKPLGDFEVLVDASSGRVVRRDNLLER